MMKMFCFLPWHDSAAPASIIGWSVKFWSAGTTRLFVQYITVQVVPLCDSLASRCMDNTYVMYIYIYILYYIYSPCQQTHTGKQKDEDAGSLDEADKTCECRTFAEILPRF